MRGMFGISELHRRNASGVQAARCAAVPMAKLEVEKVASASARTTKPEVSLQIRFMTFSCVPVTMHGTSHSSCARFRDLHHTTATGGRRILTGIAKRDYEREIWRTTLCMNHRSQTFRF
jgi:hypothetical protein